MLNWSIKWGKSYFCLSHVKPKPYWSAAYLTWSGSCLTFCGAWVASHGHVCGCVITSDVVWFVITYIMLEASILGLLDGSNMITFLLPVTIWCITASSSHLSLCALCIHVSTVHNLNKLHCSAGMVSMNMSSNCPFPFLICSQRYCSLVIGSAAYVSCVPH